MSQSLKVTKEFGSVTAVGSNIDYLAGTGALGAASTSQDLTVIKSTGASSGTLPAGKEGQIKRFVITLATGTFRLTPSSLFNGSTHTIDFTGVGGAVTLVCVGGTWYIVSVSSSGITVN